MIPLPMVLYEIIGLGVGKFYPLSARQKLAYLFFVIGGRWAWTRANMYMADEAWNAYPQVHPPDATYHILGLPITVDPCCGALPNACNGCSLSDHGDVEYIHYVHDLRMYIEWPPLLIS
jgi:hypothetical protein